MIEIEEAKAILEENGYKVMDTRNQRFLNPIYRKYRDILTPLTNHYRSDFYEPIRRLTIIAMGKSRITEIVSDEDRARAKRICERFFEVLLEESKQ